MARKLRLEYAGACYHVINRGNYRRDLFTGKGAAEAFERLSVISIIEGLFFEITDGSGVMAPGFSR
jgi:REP element-mobilizing transposase RayT